jgi:hypothetical protein
MQPQLTCPQRGQIKQSILSVAERLQSLHSRELEALEMDHVEEPERLAEEVEKLSALRDSLLDRFRAHIKSHGC